MAPSKIRKAFGAVKDRTSISIAKVSNSNSVSDLEVAIVKATRHEEQPAEEKYIKEILSLTCYSRAYISSCVNTLSKRLNKTKNWTVALKTLMLIHRLLSEGDPAYEQEIFFATRRGTRLLNMSDFRDTSGSGSCWDYSAFVRTYALYLDEKLEFRMQGRRRAKHSSPIVVAVNGGGGDEDEDQQSASSSLRTTPVREMKTERIFTRTQHLQQLMDRFLACRPTGAAKSNRVVMVALYPIVKESFHIYYDLTEILGILIDRFMQLEIPDCVKVQEIFTRIAKQFDELDCFYNWCKAVGIARSSEYPEVEKIAAKKLDIMDEFIREKSSLAQNKRIRNTEVIYELKDEEPEINCDEEDMNAIKALPPPEDFTIEEENIPQQKIEEDMVEESNNANEEQEADLLNLLDGVGTSEEQGDQLALALFDGCETSAAPAWEAFSTEDSGDWENALVISASNLKNQTTTLAGGFDMLLLNGMYQQQAATVASGVSAATGSASSVALGSSGKPTMLALPAPPTSLDNNGSTNTLVCADPFAASLAVAPPAYVQMSEMEKKQKLLIEEQIMWEQYSRDGRQGHGHGHGHVGMTNQLQTNSYGMGGSTTQSY